MSFECAKCGNREERTFTAGRFSPPTSCAVSGCRSRTFHPDRANAHSVDWQKLRLQEIIDDDKEAGRIPRTVDVELTNDLVDCCVPGDIVTVSGIVRAIQTVAAGGRKGADKALFYLYIEANSVVSAKKQQAAVGAELAHAWTEMDRQFIEEVKSLEGGNIFRLLVSSLCPGIFGQEMVKAGLILAMVSGVSRGGGPNQVAIRGDPHVLIVGDPGLGKSQMLRAAAAVHPRGVYVCGNTASKSGLTVTVVKDPQTGDYALEAGALVLADQGVCAIDEFDKLASEHSSLLEAMEQQTLSMAKAGMIVSLSARAAVIAAANPVGGHYDRAKTVCENIRMSAALLSRFDLTFIILDDPDQHRDQELSEHIIGLHTRRVGAPVGDSNEDKALAQAREGQYLRPRPEKRRRSSASFGSSGKRDSLDFMRRDSSEYNGDSSQRVPDLGAERLPLEESLQFTRQEIMEGQADLLPMECLAKYIRYVRENIRPSLSADARKVLQDFYLQMRADYTTEDATPVTTRQLEALIRLTQARAKVDCKHKATGEHATQVVELMTHSLRDVCETPDGALEFSRTATGGGISKSKVKKIFLKQLERIAERKQDAIFNEIELDEIAKRIPQLHGCDMSLHDMLDGLNEQGMLLKSGNRKWKLAGSRYGDQTASQRREALSQQLSQSKRSAAPGPGQPGYREWQKKRAAQPLSQRPSQNYTAAPGRSQDQSLDLASETGSGWDTW